MLRANEAQRTRRKQARLKRRSRNTWLSREATASEYKSRGVISTDQAWPLRDDEEFGIGWDRRERGIPMLILPPGTYL